MADEDVITQEKTKKQKQAGFWGSMSGIQKGLLLLLGVGLFFIIWSFVFGGIQNIYQMIMFVISFCAIAGLFWIILTMVSWYLAPSHFSPKKDYFTRLVNLAIDFKPTNVKDLYFRGDKDKKRVKAGKIVGLLGIPYFIGKSKLYEQDVLNNEGKVKFKKGSPVYEWSELLQKRIPIYDKIEYGNDGDTFFIYESGWLLKRRHYLRCHKSLHGDLNGDVEIYDINPVPYGSLFEYPFKQKQAQPARIMMQNQLEIIMATHEHQYDLISQGVDSAVYFNPYFRLIEKSKAEMVASQ